MKWHDCAVEVQLAADLGVPGDSHDGAGRPVLGGQLGGVASVGQDDDGLGPGAVGGLNSRDGDGVGSVSGVELGLKIRVNFIKLT